MASLPAAATYTVELRDQYGRLVTSFVRAQQKQFAIYRNKPGSCQFVLDLYDAQALPQYLVNSVSAIVFRRNGVPVFAGQLTYHEPKVDDSDKQKEVDITATGYFDQLDYRLITTDYPGFDALHDKLPFASTDVGQVAWTLLNYAQFPVPDANDTTQSTINVDGNITVQQSFIASGTANLETIKLVLANNNISGGTNLIVKLVNDASGLPKGSDVQYSQVNIPVSSLPTNLAWYEIDYATNFPALVEGQTYWLYVALDTPQTGGNGLQMQVLNTDYYPQGQAYCLQQPTLFAADEDLQFFVLLSDNSYQMTKNTYLGILQGTIQPSFDLAPTFDRYKHIKAAIEDLSTTFNGIDFAINVSIDQATNIMRKYFNVYYPAIGSTNTSLPFMYPGNIKKLEKPKDGTVLINEVFMRGQGSGAAQLLVISRDNTSIQTYGVRQLDQSEPDVPDVATLTSYGEEYIRVNKDPSDLPGLYIDGNMQPPYGSYGIGDWIRVQVNDSRAPILNFDNQYRIEQIQVTVDDDGVEEIQLQCSNV